MARNRNKKRHKKSKARVSKKKLIIVILALLLTGFTIFKGIQVTFAGIDKLKDNFGVLMTSIFGEGDDASQVNTDKQFDLEEENQGVKKKYVVYIDVGHGGDDIGYKTESGATEKDLDLTISKLVSTRLSSQSDISVIVSRSADSNLSSKERVEDANYQNADAFISIHMAGNDDSTANGVQTFYRGDSGNSSNELATLVQKSIVAYVDLKDRGAAPFTFDVLKNNNMPAILIQCGFLTNPEDGEKLSNPDFQKDLAEGIAQGILSFLDAQG